jgi:tetratricopeptide (TPR) repeat protein
MNNFGNSPDAKLQEATELLNAGRKKEARQVLREALALDNKNLKTWELIWRATYNVEEELLCLKRILAIDPKHPSAKRRLAELQSGGAEK